MIKKKYLSSSVMLVGALVVTTAANAKMPKSKSEHRASNQVETIAGEYLVKFAPTSGQTLQSAKTLLSQYGLQVRKAVNAREGLFLTKSKLGMMSLQSLKQKVAGIEYVEPNYLYRALDAAPNEILPNDERFGELWGMRNLGQKDSKGTLGKSGADIKAPQAWALARGSKSVVVAIVDTGIDYNHPDLKENIWTAADGTHGFNAITDTLDPMDDNDHGTHCAGTIGGHADNTIGVAGVAWDVRLMGVKFLSAGGSGSSADAIQAIDWATDHGANVISASWGGGGFSQALFDSIKRAADKGVVFVAAAGNDGASNDRSPAYPASYNIDNIISVAASNNLDGLAGFSNFGSRTVHLMAPGNNILSSVAGGGYDSFSGTSMATPHVSGAVAVLLGKEAGLTPSQVRERLMATSDKFRTMRNKTQSAGRLNLFNLVSNIVVPGFLPVPETAWIPATTKAAIATANPYADGESLSWEIEHPGASFMRVRFARFHSEPGYDTLKIKSADGEEIEVLSGQLADGTWSAEVPGSKIILEWKTDGSINFAGFEIDSYAFTNWTDRPSEGQPAPAPISAR